MDEFTRGSTVIVTTTFQDADGNPVNPATATAKINYRTATGRATDTISLTQSGNNWSGEWDSSAALSGPVDGHVESAPPAPKGADDFQFLLKANRANV